MRKVDLTCPRCSAFMTMVSNNRAKCEYCGHEMMIEKKESPEEIQRRQEARTYGYFSGKFKAEEEAQDRAKLKGIVKGLIIAAVILLIGLIGCVVQYFSRPLLKNPFEYLEVSFEGTDGDGELIMKVNNEAPDGIDMARVTFKCENDMKLQEGDVIVIEASSDEYRFSTSQKRYTVKGLECYLKDVENLSDDNLEIIFDDNESIQYDNLDMVLEDDEDLKIEPLKLVCYNNKTTNELYLISEVSFDIVNKKYYTVSRWEDVVVNSSNGKVVFSYGHHMGDLTTVQSFISAMLYTSYESAVRAVENEQAGYEHISSVSFE